MNYSLDWKSYVNFKELKFDEFITISDIISSGFCSQKVDGILGALVYKRGQSTYFQTTGNQFITNIPVISEYERYLNSLKNIDSIVIIGDLVAKKGKTIFPFNQTVSIVKTPNKGNNKNLICHYLYDIFYINEVKTNYKQAIDFISKINFNSFNFIFAPIHLPWNEKNFRKLYVTTVDRQGFDGIVVRQFSGRNYKIKPFKTFDLVVIGAGNTAMPAWKNKQISYLITAFIDKKGYYRQTSKLGTGFDYRIRADFYDMINKEKIQERDGEFLVKPRIVVEAEFLDYDIKEMLCYKFDGNQYIFEGKKDSVTLRNPRFIRIRHDKTPNNIDVRLSQIPEMEAE